MKQILRFNKIIKSIIIAGDLCILNALFVTLYYVLDTDTQRILLSDSLPQLLVLLNLVYLLCNYSKGVVLHRRIVRADHIVMRAVRNTFCHAVVFISLITLVHFGSLSTRFLVIFYTAFLRIIVGRMLSKIAHYLEAGSRVGGHLFVEFDHIESIAHKCNSTTVASLAAVYLDEMPEYESV